MSTADPVVYVVDDDEKVRKALAWLLASVGLESKGFASARDFLGQVTAARPSCVLLDLRMPQMGGLELQERLTARGLDIPIIFVTGYGDVPTAVRAMRAGAIDFIEKPFSDQTLIECVQQAMSRSIEQHKAREEQAGLSARMDRLTQREHEVMELVIEGLPNKRIAVQLGLSERTVEIHRAHVMEKLEVDSVAKLVCLALRTRPVSDSHGRTKVYS